MEDNPQSEQPGSEQPESEQPERGLTWKFPKVFWVANTIELFERAAFYGMFIFVSHYFVQEVGFSDVTSKWITGSFGCLLYFMPTFQGMLADKIGFRSALLLAFALLTAGYALLGAIPEKWAAVTALTLVMLGGAIVKPVISGTAAMCSDEHNRSRAMSLFYMAVNIGSFTGKSVVDPIRFELDKMDMGISGLQAINFYAAAMALVALVLVFLAYRNYERTESKRNLEETLRGLVTVCCNLRFLSLIIIVGGFWAIQVQLYATMPQYLIRVVGNFTAPGWIANVNPLVVVILVVPITYLVRKLSPVTSIGIGLLIIPLSALSVALAPQLGSDRISIFGLFSLHPLELMLIVGIAFQGIAECFLSPRFLEYASKQAPPGEVGLYMGYSHLTSAFSWGFGFIISGYLLDRWCPAPDVVAKMSTEEAAHAYDHAHYIWYFFVGIGVVAFLALIVFKIVTDRIDARRADEV